MDMNRSGFGVLYGNDILIKRQQFKEATRFLGMPGVKYFEPLEGKTFDGHGDLDSDYKKPELIGCFFHEHPDQKTMKKVGWVAELQEGSSLIEVGWDTPNLQVGALFEIPAGIDFAEPRIFRVIAMQNIMLYPVSITCEIAPEWEDLEVSNTVTDFSQDNFNYLVDNEEDD